VKIIGHFQLQLKVSSSPFRNKTMDKKQSLTPLTGLKVIVFHEFNTFRTLQVFPKCHTKDAKFGDLIHFHAYILKTINTVRIFKYMHRNNCSMLKGFVFKQSHRQVFKEMYKPW
jgi:hypothetical protein